MNLDTLSPAQIAARIHGGRLSRRLVRADEPSAITNRGLIHLRSIKSWENGDFSEPRPLCYVGWPEQNCAASFTFVPGDLMLPLAYRTAILQYKGGWTSLALWNGDVYFTEQIITFDAMIALLRARFKERPILQDPIERAYVDECCHS